MEKKDYWYGHMGNGFVVCTNNTCKQIAFINPNRTVDFENGIVNGDGELSKIPKRWISEITEFAKTGNSIFTNGGGFDADEYGYLILAPLNEPTLYAVNHCMRQVYRLSVEVIDGNNYVCFGRSVWKKPIKKENNPWSQKYRAARPDEYEPITQDALAYWKSKGYEIM